MHYNSLYSLCFEVFQTLSAFSALIVSVVSSLQNVWQSQRPRHSGKAREAQGHAKTRWPSGASDASDAVAAKQGLFDALL